MRSSPLSNTAVVIPCYKAAGSIPAVVAEVPQEIGRIYCVNDASPDNLAEVLAELAADDPRVQVVTHEVNGGVGAATVTGFRAAIDGGAKVIVKIDSDGQMDPRLIPALIEPILRVEADYVKGNRLFDIASVQKMPTLRLIGNAGLSFMSKLSSGLWHLFDPTNGFTAIHADVAAILPLHKLLQLLSARLFNRLVDAAGGQYSVRIRRHLRRDPVNRERAHGRAGDGGHRHAQRLPGALGRADAARLSRP